MSRYPRMSLSDRQLANKLYNEYNYKQGEIATILGVTQSAVCKALKQPIEEIEQEISLTDTYPMDDGCYRAAYHHGEEGLSCYSQDIGSFDDPVFNIVADWEEEED